MDKQNVVYPYNGILLSQKKASYLMELRLGYLGKVSVPWTLGPSDPSHPMF